MSPNYAQPKGDKKKTGRGSLEPHLETRDGSAVYSPLISLLIYTKKERREREKERECACGGGGESPSFSRGKVQRNAWSSEEAGGGEIFRLGGKTGAFFSFQAFIDSPLSSSATQKDT